MDILPAARPLKDCDRDETLEEPASDSLRSSIADACDHNAFYQIGALPGSRLETGSKFEVQRSTFRVGRTNFEV